MRAWTEECLVLPPGLWAALLQDAEIVVEYKLLGRWSNDDHHPIQEGNDVPGMTRSIALSREFACCPSMEFKL